MLELQDLTRIQLGKYFNLNYFVSDSDITGSDSEKLSEAPVVLRLGKVVELQAALTEATESESDPKPCSYHLSKIYLIQNLLKFFYLQPCFDIVVGYRKCSLP